MGINFSYRADDDLVALEADYERIVDEFEARRTAQAEFFEALKVAPGVREVLSGELREWYCGTPELRSLRAWALERQRQVMRYCSVRRRRIGLVISQSTPSVRVLNRLLSALHLDTQLIGCRYLGRRQLRFYGLCPMQQQSRWLRGLDIPGVEWY